MKNIILSTDSYKTSHYLQYPLGTENVSSYIEARSGLQIMFFGLQAYLKKIAGSVVSVSDVIKAAEFCKAHGVPFNHDGWMDIATRLNGKLPVRIEALPEGTIVKSGVPMVQIMNTDPRHAWLTSYLETALLRAVWYPSTVATVSMKARSIIKHFLEMTSDNPDAELPFKLHDFGARGVSSGESAELGGMAHLVNFAGSDTIEGVLAAAEYYGPSDLMAGFSIPAAEHSTITSWGPDRERDAYANMIDQYGGDGKIYAVVSDSYDIYKACGEIWPSLKEKIDNKGGLLVIRPDSGDPIKVTLDVVSILADKMGYSVNSKGYKVLPDNIRIIQGDGVDNQAIFDILTNFEKHGFSASNIAFGMGGGLLQKCNRDTFKFAMKCNAIFIDGEWKDVYKKPATDSSKSSKAGRQIVVKDGDFLKAARADSNTGLDNRLQIVYENGEILRTQTFEEVREVARKSLQ